MAQMFPSQISKEMQAHPEGKLYQAFRDQLEAEYLVFYSVNWQGKDEKGRPRDGEADFVIAHPERGILVLEAKGGAISYDGREQTWWRTHRNGARERLKRSPIEQAMESKHRLLRELRQMPGLQNTRLICGHAVAFPDVPLQGNWIDLQLARELVLDREGMQDISQWMQNALAHYQEGMPKRRVSAQALHDALLDLLGKSIELRIPLWSRFDDERQEIIRLTEEQYHLLDSLNRRRRANICGFAGSGKTMLAAEKARRLGKRFNVLLTCFNVALAENLRRQFKHDSHVKVFTFHQVCEDYALKADIPLHKEENDKYYLGELPAAFQKALATVTERFDAIIVDEGQDFYPEWWNLLLQLLRDPSDGILYIFYDDNQRLFQRALEFPIDEEPFTLTFNCRNTQNIHKAVSQFYQSEESPEARGPVGEPIEYIWYDSGEGFVNCIDDVLLRLTQRDKIPLDQIAFLTPFYKSIERLQKVPRRGPALSYVYPPVPGTVYGTTISAFKGLERPVIILAELDNPGVSEWNRIRLDTLLYVGCSRASHYLIVLLNRQGDAQVHNLFANAGLKPEFK